MYVQYLSYVQEGAQMLRISIIVFYVENNIFTFRHFDTDWVKNMSSYLVCQFEY